MLARSLGLRIVALREARGQTQEQLAWEADIASKGYLSRIEAGKRLPSLAILDRLAGELDVDVRDLFVFPERGLVDQAMAAVSMLGDAFARRVLEIAADRRVRPTGANHTVSTLAAADGAPSYVSVPRKKVRSEGARKRR